MTLNLLSNMAEDGQRMLEISYSSFVLIVRGSFWRGCRWPLSELNVQTKFADVNE